MKHIRKHFHFSDIIIISLILISFIIGVIFYGSMPARMASHWGIDGKVDGYTGRGFGMFFMPVLLLLLYILLKLVPTMDPLKENIKQFENYYNFFIAVIVTFMFYVYALTIFWNLGYYFNMSYAIVPGLSVLFFYVGILVEKAKMNYTIGIRTPWTLASENVWNKTHKLGGFVFKTIAVLCFISMFLPRIFFILSLFFIVGLFIWIVVYSYLEYRKEKKPKDKKRTQAR